MNKYINNDDRSTHKTNSNVLLFLLVSVLVILTAAIYLWPSPVEFPSDDTYIHFVYADNLVQEGGLFLNIPSEEGVGTSSILWVLLLAFGKSLGLSLVITAKALGVGSLVLLGLGIYLLLRPIYPVWLSLSASILVVLSGNLVWFSLSGLETTLFLAMGIFALICYRDEHYILTGILLGLLILTRIEGVMLAVAIGGYEIFRYRKIRHQLVLTALICILVCSPWIIYLWLRTGYPYPTTAIGKHLATIISIQVATMNKQSVGWLTQLPWLGYPLIWIGYMLEFILGGFALPKPYLYVDIGIGTFEYKFSIWAMIGVLFVVLPLLFLSLRQLSRFLHTRDWEKDNIRSPVIIFLFWTILHNICYLVVLPSIGTASRYASINHIVIWLALIFGVYYARRKSLQIWFLVGLCAIFVADVIYWNDVYDANIEHMINVRIKAAEYYRDTLSQEEYCGASDIGALRYFSRKPIADLGGLIDPNVGTWYLRGKSDAYLIESGLTCLILPGRMGSSSEGVIDIIDAFGFSRSELFSLNPIQVFGIDYDRWLFGYLPTTNAQASMTIYLLDRKP